MAKCEMCGQSISMMAFPRWYVKIDGVKHEVCKNCNAQAVSTGRGFKLDSQSGKLVFVSAEDMEVRNKCAVCGHIYCYSKYDVKRNEELLKSAKLSAMGGMAGDSTQLGNAQRQINAMVDYTKCPKCGSRDVRTLTKEEYQLELQAV